MEQMNNVALSMLQTIAGQTQLPKTGKSGETDEFQKLLEEKSQEKDPLLEQPEKAETPAAAKKPAEKAPVQKQEDPLEQVKKLAALGAVVSQPNIACITPDGEQYEAGEYVFAWLPDGRMEVIPTDGLDQTQMNQLQQIMDGTGRHIDVSDPEADAMLEATDPTVEHGPAQLLEKVVNEQVGKTTEKAVVEVQPQETDDDAQVELLDAQQAPRQIFQDVEAAPVKVGEAYDVQQVQEPDVARQIDAQLAQALQKGESVVRIQLTPERLGSVTVEISQSADGILRVALSAHSAETRGLLERHAGDLQGMLSSRGQEVQVDVQRQQESQQGQNQQNQQNQQNYEGHNGHAQDGQERRRQHQEHTSPQDFMQQLRLGLIPVDE